MVIGLGFLTGSGRVGSGRIGSLTMASGGEGSGGDLYAVLGLNMDCSDADIRNAYKKLAMRWHPDRCSSSGNSKFIEEAKEKFQAIQEAYSVLSDPNKRFLYDVGVYDSDDDENGMGDFLGEMAQMMSQTNENGHESFEELQQLFVEMFQSDLDAVGFGGTSSSCKTDSYDRISAAAAASPSSSQPLSNGNNKRDNSAMSSVKTGTGDSDSDSDSGAFCFGSSDSGQSSNGRGGGGGGGGTNRKRRNGRKQRVSSNHDVSSGDAEISAA